MGCGNSKGVPDPPPKRTLETKEEESIDKFAWIFVASEYEKLRLIQGCSGMNDLPATKSDLKYAIQIARRFGIPKKNMIIR